MESPEEKLAKAVQAINAPPCDTCDLWDRCKSRHLACADYWYWEEEGQGGSGRKIFGVSYGDLTDQERRLPTRTIYMAS